ncbi:Hsp20/alpha crystallin family protein [Desulfatibacillum aliphaticivorans]|uniref:Heat shock protein Hsp20 n=1 Tax=Desulfatibacillum aliphaticivorans TaxID=218208 RepID=B8FEZ9_DESAL|nr:Hsp20/alpha crystallin family protein [Desulfatibacillum aliphaticivorans]ACL03676.1 heat shock protein Hsp20 [Desulfatibacillum aliphaticivorans]
MNGLLPLISGSYNLRQPNFNTLDKLLLRKSLLDNLGGARAKEAWSPAMDAVERENDYVIQMEVPGMEKKDIDITIDQGVLTVKGEKGRENGEDDVRLHIGERRYGAFTKAVRLPESVDAAAVTATTKNGILTITLPKAEEEKPRQIKVGV